MLFEKIENQTKELILYTHKNLGIYTLSVVSYIVLKYLVSFL